MKEKMMRVEHILEHIQNTHVLVCDVCFFFNQNGQKPGLCASSGFVSHFVTTKRDSKCCF